MFSRRHPYLFSFLIFSAIVAGTVVTVSLLFRIGSERFEAPGEKVGVIEITGVLFDAKHVINDLKHFREDDSIKSIVLRIDSPGGGVGPAQEIFREVRKTIKTKKVIASMGTVAASGGFYIASATEGIVANPGTITGSIGVIMGYTNFQEIMSKIGLVPIVVKSGEYKDMGSPVRDMTDKEKEIFQNFADQIHLQFVRDVAEGRNMDIEEIKKLANGQIYTGEEASKIGLVDRLGNLEDAIEWAGSLGGIEGKVDTVYPKEKPLSLLKHLTGSSLKELVTFFVNPELSADYLYQPGK